MRTIDDLPLAWTIAIGQTTPGWLEGAKFQASALPVCTLKIWVAHSSAAGEAIGWKAITY
jgi:hypothetical protein